ncbi:MAG TPA: lantibiotic dehydratase [Candidatus Angelobacter sp.]
MQAAIREEDQANITSHLISVPGKEWAFWRWVCLRSAGFPIEGVFKLAASPELLLAADEVIEATQAFEQALALAHQEVNAALDELRSSGRWEEKKTRKALLSARVAINAQRIPDFPPGIGSMKSIDELQAAVKRVGAVREQFNEQFSKSSKRTTESIREIAALPEFREAITWQNRGLVEQVLDWFSRKSQNGSARNSQQRQNEEVIATYWQRYCAKNDTIGFFGPVGWAQFVPDVEHLVSKHGEQLYIARKTYWESWAIEALGAAILRRGNIQKWIAPIILPSIRIDGTVLHHPLFGAMPLTARQAALFKACNGHDTAKQIAEKLLRVAGPAFRAENEVYQLLREFAARQFIFWSFNVPKGPYPDQALRTALERIGDPDQRRSAMGLLGEFDSARQRVDAAAGNAEKLNAALNDLEQVFEKATGLSATRHHGKTYAGRTLIYEDGRRNVEVHLGAQLLQSFALPLSLLLMGGRWFTSQVTTLYRNKIGEIYSQLVRRTRDASVSATVLWAEITPLFFEHGPKLVGPIQEEFQRKWEKILEYGSDRGTITYTYEELRPRVLREFSLSRPGWAARYHSPDIMIAAASEDAIRNGDCFFVMGEAHVGTNTLNGSLFVNQHPEPDELIDATERDLKDVNVFPIGYSGNSACRVTPSLVPKNSARLEYLPDFLAEDRSKSLPISSLVVKNRGGELMASTRDGTYCLSLMDLLSGLLSTLFVDCFKIMSLRTHTPRIVIDRLVIRRESWSFAPSDLQFLQGSDPAENFLQLRRWAKSHGIPRFAFFKVPTEAKPAYLDFESPILTSIFARFVRRTQEAAMKDARVEVSEMLPTADQLWLQDKHGHRYTSELRLVAVDNGKHAAMGPVSARAVLRQE